MKAVLITMLSLLLLCSCATVHPPLPADVSMNQEAGRGGPLIVMVRVDDGEPLPFAMDTGATITCLDQSLEPRLGKRLRSSNVVQFGALREGGAYRAPKLSLGDTPLRDSGAFVATLDFKPMFNDPRSPFVGILGMDVLKHYCVQLDFQSGQVRFLDTANADKKDWGRPFHLARIGDGTLMIDWHRPFLAYVGDDCVTIDENLTGAKGLRSMIDTGDEGDGFLTPKLFQQWTNQATPPANGEFRSPNGTLGGEMYHNLDLGGLDKTNIDRHTRFNTIGIHVLSESLVTLDFPEQTMYLKRTSDWPLLDKEAEATILSLRGFSKSLKEEGQLPGWTANDVSSGQAFVSFQNTNGLDTVTLELQKKGESSYYHYTFTHGSKRIPWKLAKAWRTDQNGKTIEEFPVP